MTAPQKVFFIIGNVAAVASRWTRVKVYRSTTISGSFTEISDGSTRPEIDAAQAEYEYSDFTASASGEDYYKISYTNDADTDESQLGPVFGGDGALNILSIEELKTNFLFGIDLTDDTGKPFPDSFFEFYIKAAIRWLENRLDISIRPITVTDELHDFYASDFYQLGYIRTIKRPVRAISEFTMTLPGSSEMTIPAAWIKPELRSGQINIVPSTFTTALMANVNTTFYPGGNSFLPNVFSLSYTAGFDICPADLKEMIGKLASFGPLNVAGDLVYGAGLAREQVSIDGIMTQIDTTQSSTNAGYGARLLTYMKEIKMMLPILDNYYRGVRAIAI